jgi:hypothetical protein
MPVACNFPCAALRYRERAIEWHRAHRATFGRVPRGRSVRRDHGGEAHFRAVRKVRHSATTPSVLCTCTGSSLVTNRPFSFYSFVFFYSEGAGLVSFYRREAFQYETDELMLVGCSTASGGMPSAATER